MSFFKCPFPSFLFGFITSITLFYTLNKLNSNKKKKLIKPSFSSSSSSSSSSSNSSSNSSSHPYQEELDVILECIKEAGDNIKNALENDKLINSKGRVNDFVTETDKNNEDLIFSKLRKHFPNHKFIGEVNFYFYFIFYFILFYKY